MLQQLINKLRNGRLFRVEFIKKDGTKREMIARFGVKKYLKGGELKYNPQDYNNAIVYDMEKKAYRTIPLDRVTRIKTNGYLYEVESHGKITELDELSLALRGE